MNTRIKAQTPLTHAIIDSMVRKIDYWLNQLNDNNDEPFTFFESENFIWDISDTDVVPGLTINHSDGIVKIWWSHDTDEQSAQFYTNIDKSAEQDLSYYISLEQLVSQDLKVLEESLIEQIQLSFRSSRNEIETTNSSI